MSEAPPFILREDLQGLSAYGAPQIDVPVRLNTNENPYPPSPELVRAVADAVAGVAGTLNRYPDRDAVDLRKDLAAYLGHGLTGDRVWAANGSNEVIQQLLQAFGGPGRTALGFEPSYSMHPLIARVTCTSWHPVERDADFGISAARAAEEVSRVRPAVVFLTSPNNPTGTAMPLDVIAAVCEAAPGVVVVDEAYHEFARAGAPSALSLLPRYPGLVVTRTMSKAFAMAGARVGYLAAAPELIGMLLVVRLPYHLSAVTQAVARAALAHRAEPLATVQRLRAERDALVGWLRERGLSVADSDANFVLFGEFDNRHAVWQELLDRGVLVREVGPRRWLRVTVGTEQEMTSFKTALAGVLVLVGRTGRVDRVTKETSILVELDLDGSGMTEVSTGVPFFDHMLAQLGKHGCLDLTVRAEGDIEIDAHHTVEDTSIALGTALKEALGDKSGITRFGNALVPLDETLVQAAVDLSGRPYVVHSEPDGLAPLIGIYDTSLTRHIWESMAFSAGICLHVAVMYGRNPHHIVEAQFKAVARALRAAATPDPRAGGIPSTKGVL